MRRAGLRAARLCSAASAGSSCVCGLRQASCFSNLSGMLHPVLSLSCTACAIPALLAGHGESTPAGDSVL